MNKKQLKQDVEEQTRKKFNLLKKYYDKTWDLRDSTLHVGLFKKGTKNLEKAYDNATEYLIGKINENSKIDKNAVILDVGCGAGRTLISICERYNCFGVGVDISDEMIKDARRYLKKLNIRRNKIKLPNIKAKFIRCSGSQLNKLLKRDKKFTHIISQDALFLVADKNSLYKNLYRLLKKNGVIGIADFLGENKKEELNKKQIKLIYKMVNWSESLSFKEYNIILRLAGFNIISTEKKDIDMIKTYRFLMKRMETYSKSEDKVFTDLHDRYKIITSAVKNKKMGWGIFIAKKQ